MDKTKEMKRKLRERMRDFQENYLMTARDYGEQHLEDQVKIEYFAVSLLSFLMLSV